QQQQHELDRLHQLVQEQQQDKQQQQQEIKVLHQVIQQHQIYLQTLHQEVSALNDQLNTGVDDLMDDMNLEP
ncbi:hypothetical protein BGZ65_011395, partial [Modicella reniformis]